MIFRKILSGHKKKTLHSRIDSSIPFLIKGKRYANNYSENALKDFTPAATSSSNSLSDYFNGHQEGKGIWKWLHYFDIYHRHLSNFVGRDIKILEVGVLGGGSLDMWRSYFGGNCHVYGVDVNKDSAGFTNDYTSIFVGDQADKAFWSDFKKEVKGIDILIDDGGHKPEQQRVTLEEMLPFINPGGIYICEDIHGKHNQFFSYACGLVSSLNAMKTSDQKHICCTSPFQSAIYGVHFYPYIMVIEKQQKLLSVLSSEKHGTKWSP